MEIILGKERRRWLESQKRAIVAETLVAGATVTGVALARGVSRSMLFAWRKRLLGDVSAQSGSPRFMAVTLTPTAAALVSEASGAPTIDVVFACGARLRVAGAADPVLVAGIVKALTRA